MSQTKRIHVSIKVMLIVSIVVSVASVATNAQSRGGRRIGGSGPKAFQSSCGSGEQVAKRVGNCMAPLFDMVEGRVSVNNGDSDLQACCDRFSTSEKCVRTISRDCLSGIHKTAVSALSSATKRYHKQECKSAASRAKYADPLTCSVKKGRELTAMYKNMTSISQAIRDTASLSPEEKLLRSCCLYIQLDKEIENTLKTECPKSIPVILGIIHGMMDDARNTLCVNPKCNGVLEPMIAKAKYKPPQNFIEPTMQILFMIGTE